MNSYKQILESEIGKEAAAKEIKSARRIVKLSNSQYPSRKEDNEMTNWYQMNLRSRYTMLAITAVFADMFKGQVTVNFDQITGRVFTRKDWNELENEGLVTIYAVAHPYQFVFSA